MRFLSSRGEGGAPLGVSGLAVVAMLSVQAGAAVSTWMFDEVGPVGTASLRLCWAALILSMAIRPRVRCRSRQDLLAAGALGLISATMTICYFLAIDRIPLGTASALEFLGPLSVAIAGMRGGPRVVLWPALAAAGVLMLTRPWEADAQLTGVLFGAAAGACLGGYVVFTQKVGARFSGLDGLALSLLAAAVCVLPFGLAQGHSHLLEPPVLLGSAAAALLLPLIPYGLELIVLRRLSTYAMGTLMSFEPAIASLIGLLLLRQVGTVLMYAGIACVALASLGAVRSGARAVDEQIPASEVIAEVSL